LDSIETSSLIKCIEACEEIPICRYVQFSDNTCNIYDKTAYFSLKAESENKQRLYERKPKVNKHSKWYKKLDKNISSSIKCWEECITDFDCVTVSYHPKSECYLFNTDILRVERNNKNNNRLSNELEYLVESSKSQKLERYEKTQISGFFLYLNTQSEKDCFDECMKRREICEAFSFGENRCHLAKRGEYQLRRFNNWVSVFIENENPLKSQQNSNYSFKKYSIIKHLYF
jgi:hypothetical protein